MKTDVMFLENQRNFVLTLSSLFLLLSMKEFFIGCFGQNFEEAPSIFQLPLKKTPQLKLEKLHDANMKQCGFIYGYFLTNNYLHKVKDGNTNTRSEIFSKPTIKTSKRHLCRNSFFSYSNVPTKNIKKVFQLSPYIIYILKYPRNIKR